MILQSPPPKKKKTKKKINQSIADEADANAKHEDIAQVEMADGTRDAIPVVSFDYMEQLQFFNGLMIDITDENIDQSVEASNFDQLADALPSHSATSADATSVLDAPETQAVVVPGTPDVIALELETPTLVGTQNTRCDCT